MSFLFNSIYDVLSCKLNVCNIILRKVHNLVIFRAASRMLSTPFLPGAILLLSATCCQVLYHGAMLSERKPKELAMQIKVVFCVTPRENLVCTANVWRV